MSNGWIFVIILSVVVAMVTGGCTPDNVKDGLNKCLQDQGLANFYQIPVADVSQYSNLCRNSTYFSSSIYQCLCSRNSTCMTYCMVLVVEPCQSEAHMVYLGDGDALKAAYLALCDHTETNVTNALTCGSTVVNQDALNIISTFQFKLQSYVDASSENSTVICSDWSTVIANLTSLLSTACSGDSVALGVWTTFLNTLMAPCDNTVTPSFYDSYRHTPVDRCNTAGHNVISLPLIVMATVLLLCLRRHI